MRIIDEATKTPLKRIGIFLTKAELTMLIGYAQRLLEEPVCEHVHFDDDCYEREIMLASYSPDGLNSFSEEVNRLLK